MRFGSGHSFGVAGGLVGFRPDMVTLAKKVSSNVTNHLHAVCFWVHLHWDWTVIPARCWPYATDVTFCRTMLC